MKTKDTRYCSFCGKTEHEVKKLIAGPTCFICDECIALCTDILLAADIRHINDYVQCLKHHIERNHDGKK